MKKIRYFLLFLAVINFNAQKNNIIPIINDKPEKFHTDRFSAEIKKHRKEKIYITNRANEFVVNDKTGKNLIYYSRYYNDEGSSFSGYDYSLNPLFGIYREFYPNNVLKMKGIYCWFGFKLGKWYHYDENGKLISTEDTDQDWDFSYKKVLDFCSKNNILLERQEYGVRTQIRKYFPENKSPNLWIISYADKNKGVEKILHLDSKNGKILNEFEQEIPYRE